MIVLWGLEHDPPLARVGAELCALGAPLFFLDQRRVRTTALLRQDGGGSLRMDGQVLPLEQVRGIYLRPFDTRRVPAVATLQEGCAEWCASLATDDALLGWCEDSPARVLNRPAAMASNNSKPYQAGLIAAAGFEVPATLVTNERAALEAFIDRHGTVIYKSSSGVRSIVRCLGSDLGARQRHLATCPTQFQEYVPGVDVRVHVVGEELFATEIRSEAEDYRYAARQGKSLALAPLELPAEVGQRVVRLAQRLGLTLAGVDLRRDPAGRWVCFEVNPSPGFSFFEQATGQPIAAAVARLLARAEASDGTVRQ